MTELHLAIRLGPEFGTDFKTVVADGTVIGRDGNCGVRLCGPGISRRHAMLLRSGTDGWMIRDLESMNGTFVGGDRATGDVPIHDGIVIEIVSYRIQAFLLHRLPDIHGEFECESTKQQLPPVTRGPFSESEVRQLAALTGTQRLVFRLLLEGVPEKEAARRLGLSPHTVHNHVKAIYKKLSVSGKIDLILQYNTPHLRSYLVAEDLKALDASRTVIELPGNFGENRDE